MSAAPSEYVSYIKLNDLYDRRNDIRHIDTLEIGCNDGCTNFGDRSVILFMICNYYSVRTIVSKQFYHQKFRDRVSLRKFLEDWGDFFKGIIPEKAPFAHTLQKLVLFFPRNMIGAPLMNNSVVSAVECLYDDGLAITDQLLEDVKMSMSARVDVKNRRLRVVRYSYGFEKRIPIECKSKVLPLDDILKRNEKIFKRSQQQSIIVFGIIKFRLRKGRDIAGIISRMVFEQYFETSVSRY